MTVEELYAEIGGDYEQAVGRLRMDKLIAKFVCRLPEDPSCAALIEAWNNQDDTALFEASHAAKGVCGNLALTKLGDLASQITEAVRPGNEELRAQTDLASLVSEFEQNYKVAVEKISAFAAEQ